jgi:4-aminobutyrate aminotransferase-like enzyme
MKGLLKYNSINAISKPIIFIDSGRGCMVGLEFNHAPGSGFASAVTAACMEEGLLLLTTGWRETIRFIPPLIVSEKEMDYALKIVDKALGKTIPSWAKDTKDHYATSCRK